VDAEEVGQAVPWLRRETASCLPGLSLQGGSGLAAFMQFRSEHAPWLIHAMPATTLSPAPHPSRKLHAVRVSPF
jgi:hypothetical protein